MSMPHDPTGPATTNTTARPASATDVVIRWVGWHLIELTGVGVPLVLAVTESVWCGLIGVLIGALWAVHEVRVSRRHRAALPAAGRDANPDHTTNPTSRKDASA